MKYCSHCGAPVALDIPEGDDRPRYCCTACKMVHYQNPKMVVGCIAEWSGRILLCKRAIEPRYGTWTVPAGYLENEETVVDGARREVFEEARARIEGLTLYGLYSIRHVSQVYLIFRGALIGPDYDAGEESLETALFKPDQIPWDCISFPVIVRTLERYVEDCARKVFPFHMENITVRMKRN